MQHKLERTDYSTYNGGNYLFHHYILSSHDVDGTWVRLDDVFARSMDHAERLVREHVRNVRVREFTV